MQIGILGPLVVLDDAGSPVDVPGTRLRTLLTRLALEPGRPVGVERLALVVWGDAPPADPTNALQTLVSRLRRALGATGAVTQSASGYALAVGSDGVDAARFRALAAAGAAAVRSGAPDALATLDTALGLWRGPALADTRDRADDLLAFAAELDDLRLTAVLDRTEARLAVDPSAVDLAELEHLVADHPLHERLAGLHVRALVSAGRGADALRAYDAVRRRLADELGVDPSAELQQLHVSLLRGDEGGRAPRRTNLKAQLTSFVGREDELARVVKSLGENRLVTLVGPGGAGKTRLASEAGHRIADSAPDGVWLSALATVTDGDDVPQAVFGSLGIREIHLFNDRRGAQLTTRDATDKLRDALADRAAVLVLDNCEHVIDATARLAEQLLSDCPDLRVLATSREPLGIVGEALLAVPPLGQPAPEAGPVDALAYPAVRLFADRAGAVSPDFAVCDATVGSVVEIVRRLDGLPLAIELAAARLRTLPVDEIARRIDDRFRLLTGGSRTALPRHRTLRAVVQWSWELLTDAERALVEVLAVFPAGITSASATAVHPDGVPADEVEDILASLIDKSLLQPIDGGRRLRMLETIREYGLEQLSDRGELAAARERHARHFREVLAEAEPYLTTRDQLPWFALLTAERENILAALRHYCDVGDADAALRIAVALGGYGMMLGEHADIAGWARAALEVPGGEDAELRLMTRALLAINSTAAGDGGADADWMPQLREIVAELRGIDRDLANPMLSLMRPVMAFFVGDNELAQQWSDEAMASDSAWVRAATRMFRAGFAENNAATDVARTETALALEEFEQLGERWGLASVLRNVAQLRTLDGDLEGAVEAYERALSLMDEMGSRDDEVFIYARLADLALRRGDDAAARAYLTTRPMRETEDSPGLDTVFVLAAVGDVEHRLGSEAEGRRKIEDALSRLGTLPREHPAQGHMRALTYAVAARLAVVDGDLDRAADLADRSLQAAAGTRDLPIVSLPAVLLARLAAVDDPRRGARMLGAAAVLRGGDDRTDLEVAALTTDLRAALGDEGFAEAYDTGRVLPAEAALALFGVTFDVPGVLDQERLR
ncbi:BTAD domain-containing putative transcriptional regulator [Jatrophihabitans fulvus]